MKKCSTKTEVLIELKPVLEEMKQGLLISFETDVLMTKNFILKFKISDTFKSMPYIVIDIYYKKVLVNKIRFTEKDSLYFFRNMFIEIAKKEFEDLKKEETHRDGSITVKKI